MRNEGARGLSDKKKKGLQRLKKNRRRGEKGYYIKSFSVKHSLVAERPVFVKILQE